MKKFKNLEWDNRAEGDTPLRQMQLVELRMLRIVDDICRRHHIQYWLSGGTTLGAVRHGGSVPWDDDIDISVMRSDYTRLSELLRAEFRGAELSVTQSDIIRVLHNDSPCQVDIFAFDEYNVSIKSIDEFCKAYRAACCSIKHDFSKLLTRERIINCSDREVLDKQQMLAAKYSGDLRILAPGIETGFQRDLFRDRDWMFPLKKIKYEGMEFSCPRQEDMVLFKNYGDFMTYPSNIHAHEDVSARATVSAYAKLKSALIC